MAEVEVFLDKAEAEKLTAEIKAWAGTLWVKLRQAHDGQAWRSLGYPSWSEYVRVEFDMSRSYAYRLVSHATAVAELEAGSGHRVGRRSVAIWRRSPRGRHTRPRPPGCGRCRPGCGGGPPRGRSRHRARRGGRSSGGGATGHTASERHDSGRPAL